MTLKELKEKIAESPNKEWYQHYKIELQYPHVNFSLSIKGVVSLYEWILKQVEGYEKFKDLPPQLNSCYKSLIAGRDNIIYLVKHDDESTYSWNNKLDTLKKNSPLMFLPDLPETQFLIDVYKEKRDLFEGAYGYFSGQVQNFKSQNYFTGSMMAYEFASKDFSKIVERKEAEKKSILTARTDFQKKLGEAESEVVEYIAKSNEKFNEYAAQIDSLKTEKDKTFKDWFEKTTSEFSEFNTTSIKSVTELEELYHAKLKLEAPAKYWNERAKKLRSEGYKWLAGLITCLVIGTGVLIWVLNKTADGTLQKIFSETPTAIKWSVALITLISFLAYGIRIFSKLTFSSFHLVRDAEEREQLTYVYLALQKEKGIDQTERHLIMQSLFSRADSGLLKDDSGPTMPGQIIDQVTKK